MQVSNLFTGVKMTVFIYAVIAFGFFFMLFKAGESVGEELTLQDDKNELLKEETKLLREIAAHEKEQVRILEDIAQYLGEITITEGCICRDFKKP